MNARQLSLRKGEKAAKISALILLALGILKGIVAIVSGSVALLAGTIDSFSDAFSSIAVWAGLKLAKKKPTARFPYGYYKAETFALLIVSLVLITSSVLIVLESFQKFFEAYIISYSNFVLGIAALSAVVHYLLAKYKEKIGRQIGSQALISEGLNSAIDVYTSLLVFLGVFLAIFGFQFIEVLVGLIISLYVMIRGLLYGKDAALTLMDASPSIEKVKELKEIAESIRGVKGTHDIRLRKSGPVFFGEMHVEMQEGLSLEKAHVISDLIETKIKERFAELELVTIHIGLSHKKNTRFAAPIIKNNGLTSLISPHFGNAPYFLFFTVEKEQIADFKVVANEGSILSHKKGIRAAHLLIEENVDAVLAISLGVGPFHVLSDNIVQIYHLPQSMTIKEAVGLLNQNLLKRMTTPTEGNKN